MFILIGKICTFKLLSQGKHDRSPLRPRVQDVIENPDTTKRVVMVNPIRPQHAAENKQHNHKNLSHKKINLQG
jgi:hypothetical protein